MSDHDLTADQRIRLSSIEAAALVFSQSEMFSSSRTPAVLKAAKEFENYIRGEPKTEFKNHDPQIQIFETPRDIWYTNEAPPDYTGCVIKVGDGERHTHIPMQNRDRKVPWCPTCKLDKYCKEPADGFKRVTDA